jgi:hypothetical protein
MGEIRSSGKLEKQLYEFTDSQRWEIYTNLVAIQMTEGCSTGCSDCGLGASPGVRDYIKPDTLINIFSELPDEGKRKQLLYFASDPFDYDFDGEDYLSIRKKYLEITGSGERGLTTITSIPKGKEELIFNILVKQIQDVKSIYSQKIIDSVSISHNNYSRLEKKFDSLSYVEEQRNNIFYNTLQFPERKPIKSMGKINFWKFLDILEKKDNGLIRNYVKNKKDRLKIGRGNIENLEDERVSDYQGALLTPEGVFNIRPTRVTRENVIGQIKTPVSSDKFEIFPLGKLRLI